MQKFFVDSNQIEEKEIEIIGEDVKHISNVLRMKENEKVLVGDKNTLETYLAKIYKIETEKVLLEIIEKIDKSNEPKVIIDLYQGLPKSDKMESIIQKTTEVGVSKIIPVDMERCVAKLDAKDVKKKIERWQKIAEAAAKQSKRGRIPEVEEKINVKNLAQKIKEYDIFIIAYEEEENNTLKMILKKINSKFEYKVGVLIGPEGGITKEEMEELKNNGAEVITLGKRILRCETAPIVICANILYELDL